MPIRNEKEIELTNADRSGKSRYEWPPVLVSQRLSVADLWMLTGSKQGQQEKAR
jgi:hypothetical protein